MARSARSRQQLDSAPALFLDRFEELRMELTNEQLIAEAVEVNHAGIGQESTRERYRDHLVHKRGYTPSREDIKKLLDAPGTPRARLLAFWISMRPRGAKRSPRCAGRTLI
jgi:hypothetical protein